MKHLNTSFIKLTLALISGIIAGFYQTLSLTWLFAISGFITAAFVIAYLRSYRSLHQNTIFGMTAFLLFFTTGMLVTQLHLSENQSGHYTRHIPEKVPATKLRILEPLKPDLYNDKYTAEVEQIGTLKTHGKILLLMARDSSEKILQAGDRIVVSSKFDPIPDARNPHQFNYRAFMENRGILRQIRPGTEEYFRLSPGKKNLASIAEKWRFRIIRDLKEKGFEQKELALIQALLLGQRQDISPETYRNFAAAGAIHILAVSGLHVGILLVLLHRILSPLDRSSHGKFLKTVLLIIFLWCFAVLAGLSPSVIRAVTMFSFVAIGLQIKRRTSVLNSVFLSLLLLLLIRPQFIFEIGFQLSYLAVISIILFQPLLYGLFIPKIQIIKYLWGLLTVTIAAQAGVLPLSLYYFHQFPGLFFLSNLLILPFLGIILAMGILVILLALMGLLPRILAQAYSLLLETLDSFVGWVAQQESFLFENLSLTLVQVFSLYLFLSSIFVMWRHFNYRNLMITLSLIVLVQVSFILETAASEKNEFIVFHKSRNTVLGERNDHHLRISHGLPTAPQDQSPVKEYLSAEKVQYIESIALLNVYMVQERFLIVMDSTGVYPPGLANPLLLLTGSPPVNLDRLIQELEPTAIIADGSNFKSYTKRWEVSCRMHAIPFHNTNQKGALILN